MKPIIIDCDPGQDDAVALLMALASPERLQVLGITCVAGNVPLDLTQLNARRVCDASGRRDVPVFAGCPRPMFNPQITAEAVHGKSGLDGSGLPETPALPLQDQHAVDFIIRSCLDAGERAITICTLGPMTNLAVALIKAPSIARHIERIVFMGGAMGVGNRTPSSEFNIMADPHAAHVVLTSGVPLVMFGLDVTHQVLATPSRLAAISALGTPVAKAVTGMLEFYDRKDPERFGDYGAPLHDPCVIAWLLQPDLFEGKEVHVAIETLSPATMGRTIVDWWGVTGKRPNVLVLSKVSADRFFSLVTTCLSQYD